MTELIHRSVPLDGYKTDGRIVEAYAAVFDVEAEVQDQQGHYRESIDRAAFNRAISHAKPQGKREQWLTKVFYNHGKTLYGTPSERFSMPVGRTQHIEADSTGVLTVTRYIETPLGDEILELWRSGAINGQSFTGAIFRSHPTLARGRQYTPTRGGELPLVRRLELGLTEYGPTPIPVYDQAQLVGMRSADLQHALRSLLTATPDDDVVEDSAAVDATSDEVPVADDPPARRSDRPDQFQRRLEVALRARGIQP